MLSSNRLQRSTLKSLSCRAHRRFRYMETTRRYGAGRKRRYRDDDDDGFDRRGKRRHQEEAPHNKIRRLLVALGEPSSNTIEDDVLSVSSFLLSIADDERVQKSFTETVLQLIFEQPLKIPFLAAIARSLNVQNASLVKELVIDVCSALNNSLGQGLWREVKLLLRFLASLQQCLSKTGVFPILDELFARAADLQTESAEDGLGLELVKIILLTTAYAMKAAPTTSRQPATAILEKTGIVASAPHSLNSLVNPYVSGTGLSDSSHSFINILQNQVQQGLSEDGKLQFLPSVAVSGIESSEKHDLPDIVVPTVVTSESLPRLPEMYLSVFEGQEIDTVPRTTDLASTVLRDVLVDAINCLDFNRNAAAKSLISIDSFFPAGTFAKRGTPFDKLKELANEEPTWKPEDVAIDAVFSQLLALPCPPHRPVFYHSLLTEICKIAPTAVAPSLGRAIRYLYKNLQYLDLEIAYRFNDWFSHHLSNFGFTWKWTEWTEDLQLSNAHPKKAFIAGTLDKEIRLSFSQRIRGTLPQQYLPLIPESKDKDVPDYKFNSDDVPYSQQARDILRLIRQKGSDADIQQQISLIETEAVDALSADPLVISTDVYVTCICFAGAKSLSHVLNCIERCKERLLSIANKNDSARMQIISSVMDYWKDRPGVGVNIVDKLLNYTILTPMSVIQWVFVSQLENGAILGQLHIFELVSGTIDKVARRIRQIVRGRKQETLTNQQRENLDHALKAESTQFKQLFAIVEDALRPIAEGHNDESLSKDNDWSIEQDLLTSWGKRWLRSITRRLAIEQAWISEMLAKQSTNTTEN